MKYGEMTLHQVKDAARKGWLVILPTGCTEQQGPHLTVDWDTWFAERVCLDASERAQRIHKVHSLVLPALPFGPTPEHRNFGGGYVDLPRDLHEAVVFQTLKSMADQGFTKMVVWRGCGGHDLRQAVAQFNTEFKDRARAYLPAHPFNKIWHRVGDPTVPGGHADSFATSIAMYLRPQSVIEAKIPQESSRPVDWNHLNLDFTRYSDTGVVGDASQASVELGQRLWEAVLDEVSAMIRDIDSGVENELLNSGDPLHFLRHQSEAE